MECEQLHFSIEGDTITKCAREKLNYEANFKGAMDILIDCLQTPEMTSNEIFCLALSILNKDAALTGTYTGSNDDDYRITPNVHNLPAITTDNVIFKIFNKLKAEHDEAIKRFDETETKLAFIYENAENADGLINLWHEDNNTSLFFDNEYGIKPNIISECITSSKTEDNYGWLERNGTFHPVKWCKHEEWATEWLNKNYPVYDAETNERIIDDDDYKLIYFNRDKQMILTGGDVLVYNLGWILLHNPHQGIAEYVLGDDFDMTKAQRNFLYQYYIDRKLNDKATDLYKN